MMGHLHLGHPPADPCGEHRQEPVHVPVKAHVLDDLAPVGLERTAEVVEGHTADRSDQEVRHVRRHAPREPEVVPLSAPPRHHIVRVAESLEQPWNVAGIVLEVGVERDENRMARMGEPRREGGRLAEVLAQPDQAHVRVLSRKPSQHVPRAIAGAVVHVDDLVLAPERLERFDEARVEQLEVVAFVEDRQNDRDGLELGHHAAPAG